MAQRKSRWNVRCVSCSNLSRHDILEVKMRSNRRSMMPIALRALASLWLMLAAVTAQAATVRVLEVQDAIGPASADFIIRGIAQAAEAGAPLVVIQLDTPGGLDSSMRQIIQAILASRVPVAVFVAPEGARAASAGTYILYAAHIAAMAPATTLGAATPVALGMPGTDRKPADKPSSPASAPAEGVASAPYTGPAEGPVDAMKAKQVHDASAYIRGLAQQRGRNAEWAERAVREAVSLTATEALRDKVIDVIANDVDELLDRIDGRSVKLHSGTVMLATRGAAVQVVQPDWRQRLLSVIANPSFALVLMMIGIYGLIFEFSSPGFGLPGTVGAICLLLAAFALQLLPVNYAGLALILLGMALLAAELLSPSFGVLGVGGVIAFIAGGLLLFDRDVPGFGVPLALILGLAASSAAVVLLGGGMALKARHRPVVSGREDMIGARGRVLSVDARRHLGRGAWRALAGAQHAGPAGRPGGACDRAGRPDAAGAGRTHRQRSDIMIFDLGFGIGGMLLLLLVLVFAALRVLREYQRGVVFQLGRFWKVKGPGLVVVIPGIQQMVRVDLRVVTMDVPPQDVISRDNVSVKVNAVVFFRVVDPQKAIIQVEDYLTATSQLAQTTLRVVLGKHELDEMLAERERLEPGRAADPRRADRRLGHQGDQRRDQAHRPERIDGARHRAPGRSRTRAPRQGDPCRRRETGRGRLARSRADAGAAARGDAAALPADDDAGGRRPRLDGGVPAADGPAGAAAGQGAATLRVLRAC